MITNDGQRFTGILGLREELQRYNQMLQKRELLKELIHSCLPNDDGTYDFDISEEIRIVENNIWSYIYKFPNDKEILFYFVESFLFSSVCNDEYIIPINIVKYMEYILHNNLKDSFMLYLREYHTYYDGTKLPFFLKIITKAMKIFDEMESNKEGN